MRFLLGTVKIVATALILLLLYQTGAIRFSDMAAVLGQPELIILVVAVNLLQINLSAVRLWLLLRAQGLFISLGKICRINMISTFGGLLLPGAWGGDAVRAGFILRQTPGHQSTAVAILLIDRFLGLVAMLAIFGVLTISLSSRIPPYIHSLGLIVLGCLLLGLISAAAMLPWSATLAAKIKEQADQTNFKPGKLILQVLWACFRAMCYPIWLLGSALIGLVLHGLGILSLWLVGWGMEAPGLGGLEAAFLATIGFLAGLLPLTPGGIGVGEAAFDQSASALEGMSSTYAYAGVFLTYRLLFLIATLPGLAFLWHSGSLIKPKAD